MNRRGFLGALVAALPFATLLRDQPESGQNDKITLHGSGRAEYILAPGRYTREELERAIADAIRAHQPLAWHLPG